MEKSTSLKKIYSAEEVARCFIKLANDEVIDLNPKTGEKITEGITNLKLQKLLYFAQAAHLALYDQPIFKEEIQAWKFGPVVPTIYKKFSEYENTTLPIKEGACTDTELHAFLEEIWKLFGKYSASELVHLSHSHSPYRDTYIEGKKNIIIDPEKMRIFYKDLFTLKEDENSAQAATP